MKMLSPYTDGCARKTAAYRRDGAAAAAAAAAAKRASGIERGRAELNKCIF